MAKITPKEIALSGKLVKYNDGTTIGNNDFMELINLRYRDVYPVLVNGHTLLLTTDPVGNGFHFRKFRPSESYLVFSAVRNNSIVLCWTIATTLPSTLTAPVYQSQYYSLSTPGEQGPGHFSETPQEGVCYANGVDTLFWGGERFRLSCFIVKTATGAYDYTDQVTNTLSSDHQTATMVAEDDPVYTHTTTVYVGSILPVDRVYFEFESPNATPAVRAVTAEYTSKSPSAVNGWAPIDYSTTDTTSCMSADGYVEFVYNMANATPFMFEKNYLFWYKIVFKGAVTGTVKVKTSYVRIPWQPLQDIWDGVDRSIGSMVIYDDGELKDVTARVADPDYLPSNEFTYLAFDYAGAGASFEAYPNNYILAGFPEQMAGVAFRFEGQNTDAAVMAVDYWNGIGWVEVSGLQDGTAVDGKPFNKPGYVTWIPPEPNAEFTQTELSSTATTYNSSVISSLANLNMSGMLIALSGLPVRNFGPDTFTGDIPLYYYRFRFDANIGPEGGLKMYHVSGIPAAKKIEGFSYTVMHQGRLVLADQISNKRNQIAMSTTLTVNAFNGTDAYWEEIGEGSPITAMKPLFVRYSSVVSDLLVVCKANKTYILDGYGTEESPYKIIRNSDSIGCVAPYTMTTAPVGTADVTGQKRQVAIWQSHNGIVMFDGVNTPVVISKDINHLFDLNNASYLGSAMLSTCRGFYDPVYNEYHWVVPGSQEWVYDLERQKWFQIDRMSAANRITGGFTAVDLYGKQYSIGVHGSGYVYLLESGTSFNTTTLMPTFQISDMAPINNHVSWETWLTGYKLICQQRAGVVTVWYYKDTGTTAVNLPSFVTTDVGRRLQDYVETVRLGPAVFHSLKFIGAAPLILALYYEPTQPDVIEIT